MFRTTNRLFQRNVVRLATRPAQSGRVLGCTSVQLRQMSGKKVFDVSDILGPGSSLEVDGQSEDNKSSMITGFTKGGFFVDSVLWKSSVIAFDDFNLMWKPSSEDAKQIKAEDFKVFSMLSPPPEIIIFGTGPTMSFPSKEVVEHLRSIAAVEFMDSVNAVATHNVLVGDKRRVVSAILRVE